MCFVLCFVAVKCIVPKLDAVFALDVSVSIKNEKNFKTMKDFIKNTANLINLNVNSSLAAVVLFADYAWIRFPLNTYTNISSFHKAIDDMKYDEVKRIGTNTPDVLTLLRIAGKDGRLGLRNDTVKVVVFITDGRPNLSHLDISRKQANKNTKKAAIRLHGSEIYDQIYAIGIEGNKPIGNTLTTIANPPSLVFLLARFDAALFESLTRNLTSSFCDCKLNYKLTLLL